MTAVHGRAYHLFVKGGRSIVIIPAYNEAANIGSLIQNLKKSWQSDILVINDASTDDTERNVQRLGAPYISLPINLGIGGAVQTGFRYAHINHYDIAVQVDGDGQHDPSFIKDLVRPILHDQADVVIGSRFVQKTRFQSSYHRRLGIRLLQFLSRLFTGHTVTDSTSGFRAYNFKAIAFLADNYAVDFPEPEAIISLLKRGFRILEVPVVMRSRQAGNSSISRWKSVYYLYKVVVSMTIEAFRSPHD